MITMFGADFSKNVQNKRKRLDTFTQASLQTSNKKVKEICTAQQLERGGGREREGEGGRENW